MSKRCNVVCDTSRGLLACEVCLQSDATVAQALAAARQVLGDGCIDWSGSPVGIFGELCERALVPADGDRIELYRPLTNDPRTARRARAKAARELSRRRGT